MCQKASAEKPPNDQTWSNLSNKMNKVVLDYIPRYKRNIHEPTLT